MNHRICFFDRGSTGNSPAYAPYYERHLSLSLFDTIAADGMDIPSALWQEYTRITRLFEELEQVSGPVMRKLLLNELMELTQIYQAALCYAFFGSPLDPSSRLPAEREIIGVLLAELKTDHDLLELERLIMSLDENVAIIAGMLREDFPPMNVPDQMCVRCNKGIP
jgi:hypothetical protein